jgi:hypothetical protein
MSEASSTPCRSDSLAWVSQVVELEGVVSKLSEEKPESISKEEQTQQLKVGVS